MVELSAIHMVTLREIGGGRSWYRVTLFWKRIIGELIDPNMLWSAKLSESLQNRKVHLTDVRYMSAFQGDDFFEDILNIS